MIRPSYFISCLVLIFALFRAQGQTGFTVSVSAAKIYRNDAIRVEYKVTNGNDVRDFVAPQFVGWNIISGPSFAQQETYVNGQGSRSSSYIFDLMPAQAGKLKVPGTTITADNKQYTCQSTVVNVMDKDNPSPQNNNAGNSPFPLQRLFNDNDVQDDDPFLRDPVLKNGETPDKKMRDNVFVKLHVSATTCYAGEPILVEYKLYTAIRIQPRIKRQPAFSGCSVTEMTTDEASPAEKINGKLYRVIMVRKVQLVPLQQGDLPLDTASVACDADFLVAGNPGNMQPFSATFSSQPVTIHVKPLPDKNKPADFSGIVGHFNMQATALNPDVPAGENNTLQLSIEGRGNITGVPLPNINWPAGVDHFEPVQQDNIDKLNFPVRGIKTYNIPFLGSKEGNAVIPAISFNYFDPEKGSYEVVHTDSIPLHFSRAVKHSLKDNPAIITEDFTTRKYIWIVPVIAVAVLLAWWVMTRRDKKAKQPAAASAATAQAPAQTPAAPVTAKPVVPVTVTPTDFSAAASRLNNEPDIREFYNRARKLLTLALQEKLDMPHAGTHQLLDALRQQHGDSLVQQCAGLYAQFDMALYASALHEDSRPQVMAQLQHIIQQLKA
ncbi:BatD family protein [Deminuibacter soli]|uniref:Protein BatD n=1 Tax=Deminuibacter soli TaxID=2291815 RepID=A0A3E1ND33_9BACT|nr:BatD family protein [Deminuibacter soli]RFM25915.1 protein BatD [Deminuibacter soli]